MNKLIVVCLVGLLLGTIFVSATASNEIKETFEIRIYKQLPINYNIGLIDPIAIREGRIEIITFRNIIDAILSKIY